MRAKLLFLSLLFLTSGYGFKGLASTNQSEQVSIEENSKPIFVMNILSTTTYEEETRYYEIAYVRSSKNYINLSFNRIRLSGRDHFRYPFSVVHKYKTCFKTSYWGKDFESMNLSPEGLNKSSLSFIFKRNIEPGPKPYPLPVPLPFKLIQSPNNSSSPDEYQMKTTEEDEYGNTLYEEVTTVKFMKVKEHISALELYDEGFTRFISCSSL